MDDDNVLELVNPQTKSLAFKVYTFNDDRHFCILNKYNYFSVILVLAGRGTVLADVSEYNFTENSLICLSLYQPFEIKSKGEFRGVMVNFHPEFFCLHKHRNEVSCNGVLFNNNYESPVTSLGIVETQLLLTTIMQLKTELQQVAVAQLEVLISYLKILLINASRIKMGQRGLAGTSVPKPPVILNDLKDAIEQHFKSLHSAGDYSRLLNISTAALNKISKIHFNKTLSALITDRIIIEAKRQLYLTAKPVKLIAYELGFTDEFYFSRFFKSHVAISPQFFRDTVGFDKANA
ncbi:helix-turn-helix domain-containing protein [Mucilaginibacter ginsenosidivorax]|uniref:Helix-turn-helix domain-containing protein n=1 Tax=Mucilaginibacter ginsenosidivorax TaxID=862126 RepID=A0A5B8W193_9SPHI|nr:helix-turn-helix domain-containing protein [Mucilaginibacter ginsenosidivorax]QEC77614.1 helix-turn-helix domain-containing protein [Mucilaginibacter ginsenosidivorax]